MTLVEGATAVLSSVESQVGATAAVVVGLAASLWVLGRLGPVLKARFDDTLVEVGQTVAGALLTGAATYALVVVWALTGTVWSALGVVDVGGQTAVLLGVSVAVVVAAVALTRVTKRLLHGVATDHGAVSRHQRTIAHHVVQVSIYAVAVLVVLSLWRVDLSDLLLGAGVLGIVLGLAARQTLGAVLAGFVVLFSRPFEVGDWIQVGENEGVVRDVTVFNTRIRTYDDEVVMIPNDVVTSTDVVNRSRRGRLRVEVDVGVDYETDLDRAMATAADAMVDLDVVRERPDPRCVLARFGDSAVVVRLRFWIGDPTARKMWRARTEVIAAVHEAFAAEGIEIPFPQRELTGREAAGGFRVVTGEAGDAGNADRRDGAEGDGGEAGADATAESEDG